MASIWDSLRGVVVDVAGRAGSAAGTATLLAKLKVDLQFIDRELVTRKQRFGVEMYDYVAPLAKNPDFYCSDDTLTLTLQPPLITAQREIAALELKRASQQERIKQAAEVRSKAFVPAETWMDSIANAGKSAALGGNEAKLATEMALYNGQVQHFKQEFGLALYKTLEELEDTQQWLPTDREIRSIYDNCRKDVERIQKKRAAKEKEIEATTNGGVDPYNSPDTPSIQTGPRLSAVNVAASAAGPQPSVYANQVAQPGVYAGQGVTAQQQQVPMPQAVVQQQVPTPAVPMQQQQQAYNTGYGATANSFPNQTQQQQPQQQQQLQNNLFSGMGFDGAPPAQQDPFAPSAAQQRHQQQTQQQQQQHHDPFASSTTPQQQQQQPIHDPFAAAPPLQAAHPDPFMAPGANTTNTFTNDPFASQPTPQSNAFSDPFAGTSTATAPAASNTYHDPFAGL